MEQGFRQSGTNSAKEVKLNYHARFMAPRSLHGFGRVQRTGMVAPCTCVDTRVFGIVAYVVCVVAVVYKLGVLFSEMMQSVLLVAVSICVATAFSPAAPVAMGANLRATANIARSRRIRSAMRPALSMAGEQPTQIIDFGKVGFAEADNQVFTLPALSRGHILPPHYGTLSVGESQFPCVALLQNSEPPWWRVWLSSGFLFQTRQTLLPQPASIL